MKSDQESVAIVKCLYKDLNLEVKIQFSRIKKWKYYPIFLPYFFNEYVHIFKIEKLKLFFHLK